MQATVTARVSLWVQPGAKRSELAGRHDGLVKVRLAAKPVDGAANEELVRFLAATLGVPRSAVVIASGHAARRKVIELPDAAAARLDELAGA
ncbi:MAG TPA: DUF167 domain-containing protein [Deinococcales bacterium]|nr:DUF167 domain-containing protein [Deinococcales bacterium]